MVGCQKRTNGGCMRSDLKTIMEFVVLGVKAFLAPMMTVDEIVMHGMVMIVLAVVSMMAVEEVRALVVKMN